MNRLLLIGLNHTTAPLDVRERLSFNAQQRADAVDRFKASFPNCEIVLLSTCNRVEFYLARAVHGNPRVEELMQFLADFHQLPAADFEPHIYQKTDREMIDHLFRVASSLDSMVLGETQILGQVRGAYELATTCQTTGALLNPLFQRAIAVGKQVMHETQLGEGRLSIASIAVDYARRIFDHFDDKTLLTIGAGKMAQLVLRHFAELKPRRQLICNRDPTRAEQLALEFKGDAVPFEFLTDHLAAADIVISSTGATRPILTREHFAKILKARRYRPIFIIDIAVPRDVEASVGELESVYLYNLDDLQNVVNGTQSQRSGAIDGAQAIVTSHVEEFLAWDRSRQMGPIIDQLFKRYHAMAQEEVDRIAHKMPDLSAADREHLEELVRRVVNKLLHDPIRTLKDSDAAHGATAPYLHALTKLFDLPDPSEDV